MSHICHGSSFHVPTRDFPFTCPSFRRPGQAIDLSPGYTRRPRVSVLLPGLPVPFQDQPSYFRMRRLLWGPLPDFQFPACDSFLSDSKSSLCFV